MNNAKPGRFTTAEQLYCYTDKTMQEIAELTKIPVRSLYRRARDYKWESLRRATRRSPIVLTEEMYRELSDLTASINERPKGQRVPTPTEAELRRKIVYSIVAIKRWPTHSEAAFLFQSLLRYNEHFHFQGVDGLPELIDGFLAHRDVYGYASYQPEHNQDLNQPTPQELQRLYGGADDDEAESPYRDPDEMVIEKEEPEFRVVYPGDEDYAATAIARGLAGTPGYTVEPPPENGGLLKPHVYEALSHLKPIVVRISNPK